MVINMIQNIHYFMLDKKERVYFITLLYSFATKNLKMNGNVDSKYNVLRLENWDTFRNSDRHSKNILEVMEYYEKYNAWFNEYVNGVEASLLKKIK